MNIFNYNMFNDFYYESILIYIVLKKNLNDLIKEKLDYAMEDIGKVEDAIFEEFFKGLRKHQILSNPKICNYFKGFEILYGLNPESGKHFTIILIYCIYTVLILYFIIRLYIYSIVKFYI